MIKDVAPELLERIRNDFKIKFEENEKIKELYELMASGNATYKEVNEFAIETGRILTIVFANDLSSSVLPDGKMYFNIANRIIPDTLKKNHELVTDAGAQVQKSLNEKAGIRIRAIKPEINQDRIVGLVNKVSSADSYDSVAWVLEEPVINFTQSIVDDMIKVNADFQYDAGMSPVIIRSAESKCCEWCSKLAGRYKYPEVPKDVYRRHERCRCVVEYDPKDGRNVVQNVHTKKIHQKEKIETRKKVGLSSKPTFFLAKGLDVTDSYQKRKYPGQGKIIYTDGYDNEKHQEEIKVAQWLHDNLGGDIKLLNESQQDGIKMPDYEWNGKLWELKSTSTEKAANSAIRKAIKQIQENPGGIILNYETDIDLQEAISVIEKRMKGSKEGDIPVDVMILNKGKLVAALRY